MSSTLLDGRRNLFAQIFLCVWLVNRGLKEIFKLEIEYLENEVEWLVIMYQKIKKVC